MVHFDESSLAESLNVSSVSGVNMSEWDMLLMSVIETMGYPHKRAREKLLLMMTMMDDCSLGGSWCIVTSFSLLLLA